MTAETEKVEKVQMVNLTINGTAITVPKGTTVYQATRQLGIDVPIFCYQDRMPPFGACRVCLVEVEKFPKLQTSCTLEATEGMVVKTHSDKAVDERENILEFLLINHPLDCPICDKGGECPLQDQAIKFGPGESRFYEEKRHFTKALPLGPVLMLDRERCIVCARCTRFGDIVAGDHALEFIERGYRTEVGTPGGGPVESKFIGNTISICPVGALTSQVYRFRARPWDNKHTHSTCTLCPVGCSMTLDERDGDIMRTRACEDYSVNDIWMCDKGWFGYEFVDNAERLKQPLIRRKGKLEPATWEEALTFVAEKMRDAKSSGKLAAFGGNPLTVEENYLFQKLMREGAGVNNIDHRIGSPITPIGEEGIPPGMTMPIGECEDLDFAVLFGLDITEEFPVVWLRLKQAINNGAKVIFVGHYAPEVSKHLDQVILHAPGNELEILRQNLPHITSLVSKCKKGAFFVGSQYLETPARKAIVNELAKHSSGASLNIMEGRGNSQGARWAGMRPDIGPMGAVIEQPGLDAVNVMEEAASNGWHLLYVAGADPARKVPSKLWKNVRDNLKCLVVQDLFLTETAQQADVVLPTLCFVEKSGSFINIEGRVRKLHPGKIIPEELLSDGDIFIRVASKLGLSLHVDSAFAKTLHQEIVQETPAPSSAAAQQQIKNDKELRATFARALFDRGVRMEHNTHVRKLAKQPFVRISPVEAVKRSLKDGDTIAISANGNAIKAQVRLDEGVAVGTAVLPLGFDEIPVHNLAARLYNGMPIEMIKEARHAV